MESCPLGDRASRSAEVRRNETHRRVAALGSVVLPGESRWYFVYYRDPIVLGGCPAIRTFNGTQPARSFGPVKSGNWVEPGVIRTGREDALSKARFECRWMD